MQVSRADDPGAQQLKPLREDAFELRDGPALQQHVPVRTCRTVKLGLRRLGVSLAGLGAAPRALPSKGDLGVRGHRYVKIMTVEAVVHDVLTWRELDAGFVFEARPTKARAFQSGSL